MKDKNCKHQWDVVSVKNKEPWVERVLFSDFTSKTTVVISHCKKCGKVKSEEVKIL